MNQPLLDAMFAELQQRVLVYRQLRADELVLRGRQAAAHYCVIALRRELRRRGVDVTAEDCSACGAGQ